ncbi:hypothetical protein [Phenylobacterium sp.]|uniref:hypothetical protein n=1 Tax=Phenylobacterium sp. TaxID=1871053 RepID=UPI0025E950B1|nr:hypothetical protein [Phenylobacterium sp.]
MPTSYTNDRANLAPILNGDLEAGSAPLGGAANDAVTGNPLAGGHPKAKLTVRDHVKAHPVLAMALGGLAIGAIAAFAGRGAIARSAKPLLANTVRPALARAAARRPLGAAKLAARYPKAAARIAAGLRRLG